MNLDNEQRNGVYSKEMADFGIWEHEMEEDDSWNKGCNAAYRSFVERLECNVIDTLCSGYKPIGD